MRERCDFRLKPRQPRAHDYKSKTKLRCSETTNDPPISWVLTRQHSTPPSPEGSSTAGLWDLGNSFGKHLGGVFAEGQLWSSRPKSEDNKVTAAGVVIGNGPFRLSVSAFQKYCQIYTRDTHYHSLQTSLVPAESWNWPALAQFRGAQSPSKCCLTGFVSWSCCRYYLYYGSVAMDMMSTHDNLVSKFATSLLGWFLMVYILVLAICIKTYR